MSIRTKRCFFSVMLICASVVSFVFQSRKGFDFSIAIICVPFVLLFLLRLILPEITIFDETSNEYRSLSPIEKFGALLNLLLICIWVIAQIYCLM